jgi:hypothetical protein
MSYLADFERELENRLQSNEDTESIVRWVSEEVLKSYRNGIKAGQNGAEVKRDGKSRRPFRSPTRQSGGRITSQEQKRNGNRDFHSVEGSDR